MKTIMYPAVSLDGFIAYPNGECYSWINPDDEERYESLVGRCGCVLVGYKTYKQYPEGFRAKAEKNITTFVCTHQPNQTVENKTVCISGTPAEMLRQVEVQGFSEVVIGGGGEINGLFAAAGLIDEIIVSIHPVTLGAGIPLFGSFKPELTLKLLPTNQDIPGVTQNHYRML